MNTPPPAWLLIALLACSVGCKDESAATPGPKSIASTTPSAASSATSVAGPVGGGAAEDEGVLIVVSRTQILVGDDPTAVVKLSSQEKLAQSGLDAKHKRSGPEDLYIVPLAARLKKERANRKKPGGGTSEAIVIADLRTPYRVLIEVLFTLGQSEFDKYHLMTMARSADVGVPEPGPEVIAPDPAVLPKPGSPPSKESLQLSVLVQPEGISVKSGKKHMAPGCDAEGVGLTVVNVKGEYDFKSLVRCVTKLKARHPTETQVTIAAHNAAPYELIASLMDALRGEPDELFPDVHFAIPR